jgi:hypothetical protein
VLHHVLGEVGVDSERLVLLLIAWKLIDKVLKFRSSAGGFATFIVGFQTSSNLVEVGADHGEVSIAELGK